jgi:hypothetical protein
MDLEKKKLKEQGEASTRMKLNTLQMVIIAVGVLIAASVGGAIMLTFRYQVESVDPDLPLFTRFDRWTDKVEQCTSHYEDRTYCGAAMLQRLRQDVDAEHAKEEQKLRTLGYTQKEIEAWPPYVLDGARNIARLGGDRDKSMNGFTAKCPR